MNGEETTLIPTKSQSILTIRQVERKLLRLSLSRLNHITMVWIPRLQLVEICDLPWLPSSLCERLQTCLTLLWTLRFPVLQKTSPAALASQALSRLVGYETAECVFVDYCAGSGGPTPWMERELNARRRQNGISEPADFVLTDISPHVSAWKQAAAESSHLHFIQTSVDATSSPGLLLESKSLVLSSLASSEAMQRLRHCKTFGLFFLAFHHFPDDLAKGILRAALDPTAGSAGFAVFELQGRSIREIAMVSLIPLLIMLVAPFFFIADPIMMAFTYAIPVIPLILAFDGIVSCLRSRTEEEIMDLVKRCGADLDHWRFMTGSEMHTWPLGRMRYFAALRR